MSLSELAICQICSNGYGFDYSPCCKKEYHFSCLRKLKKCPYCEKKLPITFQVFVNFHNLNCKKGCQNEVWVLTLNLRKDEKFGNLESYIREKTGRMGKCEFKNKKLKKLKKLKGDDIIDIFAYECCKECKLNENLIYGSQ